MADQTFQLEASVVDGFSAPLKKLRDQLRDVKPPDGLKQTAAHFETLRAQVNGASQAIGRDMTGAMSGLGVSSLSAIASIAGVTAAIRRFSQSTIEMRALEQQTGATAEVFKQLKSVAGTMGFDEGAVGNSIKNFAQRLYDIKRGVSPIIGELSTAGEQGLVNTLRSGTASVDEKIREALRTAARSADKGPAGAERARRILDLLGLGDLTPVILEGTKGLDKVFARTFKALSPEDVAKAREFAEAMTKVNEAVDKASKTIAIEFAPAITKTLTAINQAVESGGFKRVTDFFEGIFSNARKAGVAVRGLLGISSAQANTPPGGGRVGGAASGWGLRGGSAPSGSSERGALSGDALENYIRGSAAEHGIDPDIAMKVARSEGFSNYTGDNGTSHGPFQLHYGGGLGDTFTKETGLHASDPSTVRQQVDFAMRQARQGGWAPWHGWKGDSRAGIGALPGMGDLSSMASYDRGRLGGVNGFVFHHTGGGGTPEGVINTLNQRGLGVQYVMDRNGRIFRALREGARGAHMLPSANGLSNANTEGMEVIARNDADVTPAQVAAAKRFWDVYSKAHAGVSAFGHGELNSHKQATEGSTIARALRNGDYAGPRGFGSTPLHERTLLNYAMGTDRGRDNSGKIALEITGLPQGWKSRAEGTGLFRDMDVTRGRSMAAASEDH